MPTVFLTGGTGFMGRNLSMELVRRGYSVRALTRHGSEHKLPHGCQAIHGDALDKNSYVAQIAPAETFVQLIGVTHPNPAKKDEFRAIDLGSARNAIEASREAGIKHFVYVSVAQPAPIMKFYIEVRAEVEQMIAQSGMNATILRPWYVLGPGRRDGPGAPLPFIEQADLLADGADPFHTGIRAAARPCDVGADGCHAGPIGGESRARETGSGGSRDS